MHNTERDNRALFSLFFFFYSPPIVEGENVITVFCNAQFPLTIFQLSRDQQQDHAYNFISRNFHVNFFFFLSWFRGKSHNSIPDWTTFSTAFSLITREILCSIKDWEGKIRYQPAIGEIDREELQREREEILVFLSWQFHTYPFSTPSNAPAAVFHLFERFSANRQRVFLPLRHPRPETSALCERTADFRLTFSTAWFFSLPAGSRGWSLPQKEPRSACFLLPLDIIRGSFSNIASFSFFSSPPPSFLLSPFAVEIVERRVKCLHLRYVWISFFFFSFQGLLSAWRKNCRKREKTVCILDNYFYVRSKDS